MRLSPTSHRPARQLLIALVAVTLLLPGLFGVRPAASMGLGPDPVLISGQSQLSRESQPSEQSSSEDFDIRRFSLDLEPVPVASAALRRGSRIDLVGSPSMVVLIPERAGSYAIRSLNSERWTDWVEMEGEDDEAPDGLPGEEGFGSVPALGPIWIGSDAEAIEVAALSGSGALVVETLDPIDRPDPALVVNALPGQPTIQPRANWATRGYAVGTAGCENGPSLATNIRAAVVHHTVTGNSYSQGDVDDQLRAIYRLHVDINGWCDIAYNFVVDRFGTIWEARSGGADQPVIGGHAKGFNTWTVGIALLGQHQAGASPTPGVPTSAAIGAVQSLIGWKLGLHGVDPNGTTWLRNLSTDGVMKFPSGSWVEVPTVLGHRDLGVTSCPGSHTMPSLPGIRAALRGGRVGDPPYSFVAHTPYEHGPGFVVLDNVGGLRPAGSANQPLGELVPNGSVALAVDGGPSGGYILTSASRLVDYGNAPTNNSVPSGSIRAVDLAVRADGASGWVLDVNGGVHGFGGAPGLAHSGLPGAVAFDVDDSGLGYAVSSTGSLAPIGGAGPVTLGPGLAATAVDIGVLPLGTGGWVVAADGSLAAFGNAQQANLGGPVNAKAVIAASNGKGGWVLDAEGRLQRFGGERPILPISTTVGVPTMVDVALVDWIADERSDLIRFVFALSELFLGQRLPPLEADFLGHRVVFESRGEVVGELAHSDAWAGRLVDQLYQDVLGRPADATGRAYWVDQLANGTRTQDLGAFFYGSPEYFASAGSAEAYVTRLYRVLLERQPDPEGLAFWVGRLEAGTARPTDISVGFYQSPESRFGRVDALYRQILQRPPDDAGRVFWAERLHQIDDIELAIELASSVEYYKLTTPDQG